MATWNASEMLAAFYSKGRTIRRTWLAADPHSQCASACVPTKDEDADTAKAAVAANRRLRAEEEEIPGVFFKDLSLLLFVSPPQAQNDEKEQAATQVVNQQTLFCRRFIMVLYKDSTHDSSNS